MAAAAAYGLILDILQCGMLRFMAGFLGLGPAGGMASFTGVYRVGFPLQTGDEIADHTVDTGVTGIAVVLVHTCQLSVITAPG